MHDPDMEIPSWVAQYRKLIVVLGGAVVQAGALWQDAHPAVVGTIAFVAAAIMAAVGNEQKPS